MSNKGFIYFLSFLFIYSPFLDPLISIDEWSIKYRPVYFIKLYTFIDH